MSAPFSLGRRDNLSTGSRFPVERDTSSAVGRPALSYQQAMAIVPALDLRMPQDDEPHHNHAPANIEAEQALLGALLYDNAVFERLGDNLQARTSLSPSMAASTAPSRPRFARGSWPSRS